MKYGSSFSNLLLFAAFLYAFSQNVAFTQHRATIDSRTCAECHAQEYQRWQHSDHAHAMDHADESSVLGDFNEREFRHLGFDDLLLLKDEELVTLLQTLQPPENTASRPYSDGETLTLDDFAIAVQDSVPGLRERITQLLALEKRDSWNRALKFRERIGYTRPGEIAIAQRKINDRVRELATQDKITFDFAVVFRMTNRDGKYFMETENRDGKPQVFEVKYVLGVRPLQQYLTEFPDGRVQCLPLAWDINGKRWFHLYPKERILASDPLHWTRPLQNWNRMCAECHTTNMEKNFDMKTNTYKTSFSEIRVGCEACHVRGDIGATVKTGKGACIFRTEYTSDSRGLDSCSVCHARKRAISGKPLSRGERFLDRYVPETPDLPLYYPDGQFLEEDFEYGSFLQSRMFHYGVRCNDCHDSHSLELKFEGNTMCARCHSPAIYDTPSHHFHSGKSESGQFPLQFPLRTKTEPPTDSGHVSLKTHAKKPHDPGPQDGTRCVDCHMPQAAYMLVDKRRDHSMHKPRPQLTIDLGVPNACNSCHYNESKGEDAEWAKQWIERWYTHRRETTVGFGKNRNTPHFAYAIAGGRATDPASIKDLIAVAQESDPREVRPITRAAAVALLARFSQPEANAAIEKALLDPEEHVRLAAVLAMEQQLPAQQLESLLAKLTDPVRAVRVETARILAPIPKSQFSQAQYQQWRKATEEYLEGLTATQDTAEAHINIGIFRHNLIREQLAERPPLAPEAYRKTTDAVVNSYRTAIVLDELFIPARVNLAMLYDERGQFELAEKEFQKILDIDPSMGEIHYSLALFLAERGRFAEALPSFAKAAALLPNHARLRYNYGLALLKLNRKAEAKAVLSESLKLDPNSVQTKNALELLHEP